MVDEAKLDEFVGRVVTDMGGAVGALLAYVGDKLGLYRAMAGAGPMTAADLAKKTGTNPRMIAEWLASQAAGGYVLYDAKAGKYVLPEEQAIALAQGGPALGAQAGEARLRQIVTGGGFTRFRRAAETPVNMVLEARP
jgi:hypothetical protein